MRRGLILAVLLGLVATGCTSSSSPGVPTQTINLTGTWAGNLTVQGAAVRMTWTLTQADATNVTGPVTVGLSTGTVLMNGFLTGTLSGTSLTYTISVGPGGIPDAADLRRSGRRHDGRDDRRRFDAGRDVRRHRQQLCAAVPRRDDHTDPLLTVISRRSSVPSRSRQSSVRVTSLQSGRD